jgi:hypothetical protein
MSQNKVVSIKIHPKYRDLAALRRFLVEGQDHLGTKVDMTRFIASDIPEVQAQLLELNEWAKALQEMPEGLPPVPTVAELTKIAAAQRQVDFSHYRLQTGRSEGKSLSVEELMIPLGPLNPFQMWSDPPRGAMFAGGLKKGEFSTIAAIPMGPPPTLTAAYAMVREGVNIVIENKMEYMVRGRDDANPST